MQNFPTLLLRDWFLKNRRVLPWRENATPYRVWISEIMLQQTQVAVVIPYFENWMRIFPTIEALAHASIDEVLKCWEGLGYYSRARNLHAASQYILQNFGGQLPSDPIQLAKIKGIGPYTLGAIRGFAFKQKAAAVDGNVLRVLCRFLAFQEEIDLPKSRLKLQKYAESILPDDEPWIISEALIELGATVCTKKAQCLICPLKKECLSMRHHLQFQLPKKCKRPKAILLQRLVAVIVCQGTYLLKKGEAGKVMADLYEFPYLEQTVDKPTEIVVLFEKMLGLKLNYIKKLPAQQHTFTHYRANLFPHLLETDVSIKLHLWRTPEEIAELPFSSGHRRILNSL